MNKKNLKNSRIKYIFYFLIILIIIYLSYLIYYKYFSICEKMSMREKRFNTVLLNNGIEIDIDNKTLKKCNGTNCVIKKYKTLNFNTDESNLLAKNKPECNRIFIKNGIPAPKHWIIDDKNISYYRNEFKVKFPCVLKPIDGMQGTDVNTHIKNREQYVKILDMLYEKYVNVMLEEQVYGNNYRIFIFNNTIIDVIERKQPFIIGNGKNKVSELIKIKNDDQIKNGLFETVNLSLDYIEEQGYKMDSILEKNKEIYITNTINFHNGANPVRIDLDKIPQINKDMFVKSHKLIGLEVSGIDYMSDDITISYKENNGHIIEINSMVDTQIHVEADNRAQPNFLFDNISKTFN